MSERLNRRLDGGPSRTAVTASLAIVIAAFVVAFAIALDSTRAEPRPSRTVHNAAATHQTGSRTVKLRPVAALPDLRPAPRPRRRPRAPRIKTAPAAIAATPVPTSTPAPVSPAPEPATPPPAPAPAAPAPAQPPPAPAPVPSEPSPPQPSFDSSGEFDSSG